MIASLPTVVVANLHRRYTGVSATVAALIPSQRQYREIAVLDTGRLGLGGEVSLLQVIRQGWAKTRNQAGLPEGRCRVLHARRDVDLILGWVLKHLFRQPWRVVFTSAAPKPPGRVLAALIDSADAVVATSKKAARFVGRADYVIPHGVDTQVFSPDGDRPAIVPSALQGQRLVGCFGRLRYSKGLDLLVDALIACLPRHPAYSGVISGLCQSGDQAFVEAQIQKISAAGLTQRIVFIGDLPPQEIPKWYRMLSIYVAPSRSEGFGLTPFEAMASGIPVITSQAGVWGDLIDPSFGLQFITGDARDLEAKLDALMSDETSCDLLGKNARQAAKERFSIESEAHALELAYRDQLEIGNSERVKS